MKKLSRNDLCWCGSNQKYKKCHLDKDDLIDQRLDQFRKQGYLIPSISLVKTSEDIAKIRKSCQLAKATLDELEKIIKPGISTNEIDKFVYDFTLKQGAYPAPLNYRGYPKSTCTSLNNVICHGIPDETILKEGDILNVDVTTFSDGYYGDINRMFLIGAVSKKAELLVKVTKECLDLAIKVIKPFIPASNIGLTIETHAKKFGFSVVSDYGGHGIGANFHEEPFIYHYYQKERDFILRPNMVFTIEPMINEGKPNTKLLKDKWTAVTIDNKLSSQWEHTIAVTEDGYEILSL
ncbi:MAG: methionyl aminopeptidase [Candidatus Margulisiibacteriota bacterium]|jgi:methionyl aminopeptidase